MSDALPITDMLRAKKRKFFLFASIINSNSIEFEGIRNEAARDSFFLSAKKWGGLTGAKGLIASTGHFEEHQL